MHKTSFVSFKSHKNKNIYYHFKKYEQLLALMLEKNKYQSFNNLGNEAEINLYFDLSIRIDNAIYNIIFILCALIMLRLIFYFNR